MDFLSVHNQSGIASFHACQEEGCGKEKESCEKSCGEKEETRQAESEEGSSKDGGEEKDSCKESCAEKTKTRQADGEEVRS